MDRCLESKMSGWTVKNGIKAWMGEDSPAPTWAFAFLRGVMLAFICCWASSSTLGSPILLNRERLLQQPVQEHCLVVCVVQQHPVAQAACFSFRLGCSSTGAQRRHRHLLEPAVEFIRVWYSLQCSHTHSMQLRVEATGTVSTPHLAQGGNPYHCPLPGTVVAGTRTPLRPHPSPTRQDPPCLRSKPHGADHRDSSDSRPALRLPGLLMPLATRTPNPSQTPIRGTVSSSHSLWCLDSPPLCLLLHGCPLAVPEGCHGSVCISSFAEETESVGSSLLSVGQRAGGLCVAPRHVTNSASPASAPASVSHL